MSHGLAFSIGGKKLIWWSISSDVAKELEIEVSEYLPEKVVQNKRPKLVF
jgi:hypothetical protein